MTYARMAARMELDGGEANTSESKEEVNENNFKLQKHCLTQTNKHTHTHTHTHKLYWTGNYHLETTDGPQGVFYSFPIFLLLEGVFHFLSP